MQIAEIEQTGAKSPAQWEGRLVSGEPIYIRYRWGRLSVKIGPVGGSVEDALSAQEWFDRQIGGDWDGEVSLEDVYKLTGLVGPKS